MAVIAGHEPITTFEQWYEKYDPTGGRDGTLDWRGFADCANFLHRQFLSYKNEMDARVSNYYVLEKLAAAEVISPKPDLPNISSGETAGLIRRIARNLVQNCPNVEVVSCYDNDSPKGIFSKYILTSKIIGSDHQSNKMQQSLFASAKTALTLGFACIVPCLTVDPAKGWHVKYDTIHYRDVFPEPGCKDIRDATRVYVRRYLTHGEACQLIVDNAPGWDMNALRLMVKTKPQTREHQSNPHQNKKHRGQTPEGYEVITLYTSSGEPHLTFDGRTKMLLRIEQNKHPMKKHPVFFLILEEDDEQPLGVSQVELLVGRQDFQDLMLNGAMKLWYRNINPSILGYGTDAAIPNLSPGKYTKIANPNAKVEAFEVNTQTLMQYGQISQQNLGSMVSMIGAADQQMAMQSGGSPTGMSATPQGVQAQQAMVDITTNNYQKAIESFFSDYCSYALTIYFQELQATKRVKLTADARLKMMEARFPVDLINDDDTVDMDYAELAKEYWVLCVPGSLTELEDEKQLRVLNEMFIPLSQALPAIAAAGDPEALGRASKAMMYIISKQIELSGSKSANEINQLWRTGDQGTADSHDQLIAEHESRIEGISMEYELQATMTTDAIKTMQDQISMLTQNMGLLLNKIGVQSQPSESSSPTVAPDTATAPVPAAVPA